MPAAATTTATDPIGLAAALAAAVLWAGATILYGRAGQRVGPATLNLVKCSIAAVLFAVTLAALGQLTLAPFSRQPAAVAWLALSGVVGISVGDTAYFAAMRSVGPRLASLLTLLAVPATALGGWLFLGERLPPLAWAGVATTAGGVGWVVAERRRGPVSEPAGDLPAVAPRASLLPPTATGSTLWGVLLGVVAASCHAGGQLLNRAMIRDGDLGVLWTAAWRLVAGVIVLALILPVVGRVTGRPRPRREGGPFWRYLIPAMLMGTYAGIWLQQVAMSRAEAGYAQTLLSTSPIWVLPLAALSGERVSGRAVLGSLVALVGVVMVVASAQGGQ